MALPVGKAYLVLYNGAQVLGWTTILVQSLLHATSSREKLYSSISPALKIFQTLAVLEVLHTAIGLVKSSPILTAFQVASRIFVLWCVLEYSHQARQSVGFPMLLVCWTFAEIVRYSFYTAGLLNLNIPILTWLRYTMFIILYPFGITGELLATYSATQKVAAEKPLSSKEAPNWVWGVYVAAMVSYIPVFPVLYGHMLAQRKKVLSTHHDHASEQPRPESSKTR